MPIPSRRWDLFCHVIDNHGDVGVCWRLAADLATRGHTVRLWIDDASALTWMAPQGHPRVRVHPWPTQDGDYPDCADVVIEAFGCTLPELVQARLATSATPVWWVNLEYLSAEAYVERQHGLPSPVLEGPAKGLTKFFFFPGLTARTGGLLREPDLLHRQAQFDRAAWRAQHAPVEAQHRLWVSLFCYDPAGLSALIDQLARGPWTLQVTPGRAHAALTHALAVQPPDIAAALQWQALTYCSQAAFDALLWGCDLNFVRGEDSWVRALWAGQAFIWQVYPQEDLAHHAKLNAFLDWLNAPDSLRRFHHIWNGLETGPLPRLSPDIVAAWRACVCAARADLLAQTDLVSQLQAGAAQAKPDGAPS